MATGMTFDLKANASGFKSGIGQAQSALGGFGSAIGGLLGKFKGLAGSLLALNTQVVGFQGAMKGLEQVKTNVKLFSEFEAGMKKIAAVTGASADELSGIEKVIEDVGKATQFSVADIQEGVFNLGTLGVKGLTNFKNLVPSIATAATSLDVGFSRAAEIVLATLNMYGRGYDQAADVADKLVGMYTSSAMNVEKYAVASQYAGTMAAGFGRKLEDILPLLMALSDRQIDASIAGTQLRTGMLSLLDPTSEARKEFAALGVNLENLNAEKQDFIQIIGELEKSGVTLKQMADIFGKRAIFIFETLLLAEKNGKKGAGALREYQKELLKTGIASEHAAKRQTGLKWSFLVLSATTDVFMTKLGKWVQEGMNVSGVTDAISKSVAFLTEMVDGLSFDKLKTAGIQIFDPTEIGANLNTVFNNVMPALADWFGHAGIIGAAELVSSVAKMLPAALTVISDLVIDAFLGAGKMLANILLSVIQSVTNAINALLAKIYIGMGYMLKNIPGMGTFSNAYLEEGVKRQKEGDTGMNAYMDEARKSLGLVMDVAGIATKKYVSASWGQSFTDASAAVDTMAKSVISSSQFSPEKMAERRQSAMNAIAGIPTAGQKNAYAGLIAGIGSKSVSVAPVSPTEATPEMYAQFLSGLPNQGYHKSKVGVMEMMGARMALSAAEDAERMATGKSVKYYDSRNSGTIVNYRQPSRTSQVDQQKNTTPRGDKATKTSHGWYGS